MRAVFSLYNRQEIRSGGAPAHSSESSDRTRDSDEGVPWMLLERLDARNLLFRADFLSL